MVVAVRRGGGGCCGGVQAAGSGRGKGCVRKNAGVRAAVSGGKSGKEVGVVVGVKGERQQLRVNAVVSSSSSTSSSSCVATTREKARSVSVTACACCGRVQCRCAAPVSMPTREKVRSVSVAACACCGCVKCRCASLACAATRERVVVKETATSAAMAVGARRRRGVMATSRSRRSGFVVAAHRGKLRHRNLMRTYAAAAAAPLAEDDSSAEGDAEEVGTETIRIKMKAYFSKPLNYACEKIREIAAETGAQVKGPVMLPTKRKIWCVLRSPHVNKDSREHFEMRTHTRFIDVVGPSTSTIDQLMELQMPAGVGVTIKLL